MVGGAISEMGYEAPTATGELISLRKVVVGDLDGDGHVTRADVSRFVKVLLDPAGIDDVAFRAADMNDDGRIDDADVRAFESTLE